MDHNRSDWMQTHSGLQFFPLDPRGKDIQIADIAHALAHQCRYAGHTHAFYSVAQHSVLVSHACDPADALWGLLHDATEAYLVDIPRPIKRAPELAGYRELEARLEAVIADRFGLALPIPASVKRADVVLLATERRDIMGPPPARWRVEEQVSPLEERIVPWRPEVAREMFLARFYGLTRAVDREPNFSAVFTPSTIPAPPDDDEPAIGDVGGVP